MVLVTTLAGFYLGGRSGFDVTLALNLLAGTALAAGGTLRSMSTSSATPTR